MTFRFRSTALAIAMTTTLMALPLMAENEVPESLTKALKDLTPETPTSVKETPVKGLYEVLVGGEVVYLNADASYLIRGEMIDLKNKVNLTDLTLNGERKKLMDSLPDSDTVMFKPKGDTKHTITVFTDIDCPYCVKLHQEMDAYHEAGIAVRYALYPRAGFGSSSYDKLQNVWCADDQNVAMTQSKSGQKIETKACDNPIKEHVALAQKLGVTGTPAIVLEGGQLLPGYRPAKALAPILDHLSATN